MEAKSVAPVEIFKPAIVWRASQCGWLRVGKTGQGHDIWEKPNGDRLTVKSGVEPLVPMKPVELLTEQRSPDLARASERGSLCRSVHIKSTTTLMSRYRLRLRHSLSSQCVSEA